MYRHETTPPWGKKRKRELSSSPSPPPDHFAPRDYKEIKRLKTEDEARPPWSRHSDPLSPSSLSSSAAWRSSKNDDLTKAVKTMFDWTRSDEPVEESLLHMKRIVNLCQDEASGVKKWKTVIATYQSLGATSEDVNDLIEAREPFWTQTRVRHVSSTIATPRALADSIRSMVEESERNNGRYLDRELKDQLMKAVDRVFPRAPPVLLNAQSPSFAPADPSAPAPAPALSGHGVISDKDSASSQHQAPVAQMARNNEPAPVSLPPAWQIAHQEAHPAPPTDPRLMSRRPGWAPSSDSDSKPRAASLSKPRTDSLTESSSRKSSAATLVLASPAEPSQTVQHPPHKRPSLHKEPSQHLRPPSPEPFQVSKPKRPTRWATEAVKPVSTEPLRDQRPPSPSASPKSATTAALPIQFRLATGSNSGPVRPRPHLGLDVEVARKSIDKNVFATPSSASSESRRSSAHNLQPPTRPRSLPLFQARITPKEPLNSQAQQKKEIMKACDHKGVPAQETTPCSSKDGSWLLHFKDIKDLQTSLGKWIILSDISIPVLTYAPGQLFQTFAMFTKPEVITSIFDIDIINTLARSFRPRKFTMRRQMIWKNGSRKFKFLKWLLIFEEPLDRENFNLDMTTAGFRDTLEFFGLSSSDDSQRCWLIATFSRASNFLMDMVSS
ncbi:hypothetical protein D6D01_07262 [Aureobasidium pullulans]|uniref:Uncharacterized protein n=1 Tax=Aureobasidium pullulans TaxID=5580 RepID=A0A4V6TEM6_AURPU|nr:hypothetical protein D6D01_07262 [Aureobasidium pullulans]